MADCLRTESGTLPHFVELVASRREQLSSTQQRRSQPRAQCSNPRANLRHAGTERRQPLLRTLQTLSQLCIVREQFQERTTSTNAP
ncbi:hypothetical protein [Symmachiella macrocystis]|uniref:hypothetical protein n=1 Tax=Symmachiella macrocystis TaxID=2527985 RepID=UPI0011B394ED|nr:hypothetical protein [Symmachiella macrocystis]